MMSFSGSAESGTPRSTRGSRTLWNEDPHVRRRTEILLRLESALDAANAIEPPASLAPEPIELFPGGQA